MLCCEKCKTPVVAGAKFCSECGNQLLVTGQYPAAATAVTPTRPSGVSASPATDRTQVNLIGTGSARANPPSGDMVDFVRGIRIAGVLLGALVLLVLAVRISGAVAAANHKAQVKRQTEQRLQRQKELSPELVDAAKAESWPALKAWAEQEGIRYTVNGSKLIAAEATPQSVVDRLAERRAKFQRAEAEAKQKAAYAKMVSDVEGLIATPITSNYWSRIETLEGYRNKITDQPTLDKLDKALSDLRGKARKEEAAREAAKRERKQALATMKTKYDDVEEITWYYDRSTPRYSNEKDWIELYIGKRKGESPWLRFRINYTADDWLFIHTYKFKIDGTPYQIDTLYGEVERDHDGGEIWEWYDVAAEGQSLSIAQALANSNSATLRCIGDQYHNDRKVSSEERAALRRVLRAYEALK
jgi:hypothetical protein